MLVVATAAGCGGAGKPAGQTTNQAATNHVTAAQRKYMGSQYCTSDWNDGGQTPSGESPPVAYGQFLTVYPKIRIYEIHQSGSGVHPAFTCALIAATRLDQISDVYADTFNGAGWQLDQTDAHSMQANGVSAAYPPNATITSSGQVRLQQHSSTSTSGTPSGPATTTESATSAAPSSTTGQPVLGRAEAWPHGGGFGQVKPRIVGLGGDPTSVVFNIHWQSWGGAEAVGTGMSTYVAPNTVVADNAPTRATIVAFDLSSCGGRRAYAKVEWYFPQHGQHFAASRYDAAACTGP